MKILFLDMDGVLNSEDWYNSRAKEPYEGKLSELCSMIDPDAVARLNDILRQTHCKIVLSSSWRCMEPITMVDRALKMRGLKTTLLGATPSIGNPRGGEIQAWLDIAGPGVERFVILDDSDDMVHLAPKLVLTTFSHGLQDEHVERAVKILSGST